MDIISFLASLLIFVTGSLLILRLFRLRLQKDRMLKAMTAPEDTTPVFQMDDAFGGKKIERRAKAWAFKIPIFGSIYRSLTTLGWWSLILPALAIPFLIAYPIALFVPFPLFPFEIKYGIGLFLAANVVMIYLAVQASKYQTMLMDDIPVFLDGVSRGLRVGKSFEDMLGTVGDELNPPMRRIVQDLHTGVSVGFSPVDLLIEQAERTGVEGFYFIAAALSANQVSGGSIAASIESLSISQRMDKELTMKVKSLTSEANFAGYFLAGMPFIFLVLLTFTKPQFVARFYDTIIGHWVLVTACFAIYIAIFIMQKLTRIKV